MRALVSLVSVTHAFVHAVLECHAQDHGPAESSDHRFPYSNDRRWSPTPPLLAEIQQNVRRRWSPKITSDMYVRLGDLRRT